MSAVKKLVPVMQKRIPFLYNAIKPRMQLLWQYARVELKPPRSADIPAIQKGFADLVKGAKTMAWTQVSVREAWLNTLVAMEIMMIFFIGESIGRRRFVGYYVAP